MPAYVCTGVCVGVFDMLWHVLLQAARKHLMAVVLPAWQATCRESATSDLAPTRGSLAAAEASGPVTYLKDMSAPAPFAASDWLEQQHAYAIQVGP